MLTYNAWAFCYSVGMGYAKHLIQQGYTKKCRAFLCAYFLSKLVMNSAQIDPKLVKCKK